MLVQEGSLHIHNLNGEMELTGELSSKQELLIIITTNLSWNMVMQVLAGHLLKGINIYLI